MATDSELDIIEGSLEPTEARQSDILGRHTSSLELVLDVSLGRLEKDMMERDCKTLLLTMLFLSLSSWKNEPMLPWASFQR